jgi:hypothetical protein
MIGEFCPKVFALNVDGRAPGWKPGARLDADHPAWIGSGFRSPLLCTAKDGMAPNNINKSFLFSFLMLGRISA